MFPVNCRCRVHCGDFPEADDHPDAVCKQLPIKPREPLVEIVMVPRRSIWGGTDDCNGGLDCPAKYHNYGCDSHPLLP